MKTLRKTLEQAFVTTLIAISTWLALARIPLLPNYQLLEVLAAAAVGGLAYKSRGVAAIISFELLLAALGFQLLNMGLTSSVSKALALPLLLGLLVIMGVIIVLPLMANSSPASYAIGTIAGVLMLTPLYFAAISVLVVAASYRIIRTTRAIFFFLLVYLPLQLVWSATPSALGQGVILYANLDGLPFREVENFPEILSSIASPSAGVDASTQIREYMGAFPALLTFGILLALGMYISSGTSHIAARFGKSLTLPKLLGSAIPLVGSGLGVITFLYIFQELQAPLLYRSGIAPLHSVLSVSFSVIFSSSLVAGERYLSRKELSMTLAAVLGKAVKDLVHAVESSLHEIERAGKICVGIDLVSVRLKADRLLHLAKDLEMVIDGSDLVKLTSTRSEIAKMHNELTQINKTTGDKVLGYHRMGLEQTSLLLEKLKKTNLISQSVHDHFLSYSRDHASRSTDELLSQEENFSQKAIDLVTRLVNDLKDTYARLRVNFDLSLPERNFGLDLAGGYLEARNIRAATQIAAEEVSKLQAKYLPAIRDYLEVVASLIDKTAAKLDVGNPFKKSLLELKMHLNIDSVFEVGQLDSKTAEIQQLIGNIMVNEHESTQVLNEKIVRSLPIQSYDWGEDREIGGMVESILGWLKQNNDVEKLSKLSQDLDLALGRIVSARERYEFVLRMLMSYHAVEPIIFSKLKGSASVDEKSLPLTPKYAQIYIKLYALHHHQEVALQNGQLLKLQSSRIQS